VDWGARGHTVNFGGYGAAGSMGHAEGVSVARRSPSKGPSYDHRREPSSRYGPRSAAGTPGRYHTDRQPGAALQNTAMCPAAPPPDAACAAGQSHSTHDTVISPGPHSCPFWHRSG